MTNFIWMGSLKEDEYVGILMENYGDASSVGMGV
jgi:hypothetical protein